MAWRLVTRAKRLFAYGARFRLSSLLLLTAIVAILLAWRRDHLQLAARIQRLENPNPHWGVDEATGPPDTQGYGDITTAWASKTPDGQREWLMLEFAEVAPVAVHVYETYNPGAVDKITRVNVIGQEQVIWQGADPTPASSPGGVSKFAVSGVPKTQRIKVYLNSPAVPGWNEIDAVALIDAAGQPHWARRATASSSYGPRGSLDFVW
jgi:hypothetical protein